MRQEIRRKAARSLLGLKPTRFYRNTRPRRDWLALFFDQHSATGEKRAIIGPGITAHKKRLAGVRLISRPLHVVVVGLGAAIGQPWWECTCGQCKGQTQERRQTTQTSDRPSRAH